MWRRRLMKVIINNFPTIEMEAAYQALKWPTISHINTIFNGQKNMQMLFTTLNVVTMMQIILEKCVVCSPYGQ
jgi:hypothetical protein